MENVWTLFSVQMLSDFLKIFRYFLLELLKLVSLLFLFLHNLTEHLLEILEIISLYLRILIGLFVTLMRSTKTYKVVPFFSHRTRGVFFIGTFIGVSLNIDFVRILFKFEKDELVRILYFALWLIVVDDFLDKGFLVNIIFFVLVIGLDNRIIFENNQFFLHNSFTLLVLLRFSSWRFFRFLYLVQI